MGKNDKNLARLSIFILGLILILVPNLIVKAQSDSGDQQPGVCEEIQFLLLIDHSLSMETNDNLGLRYYAPVHLADVLAHKYLDALNATTLTKRPVKVKMAVVYFSSSAKNILPWTTIAPVDLDSWNAELGEITKFFEENKEKKKELYEEIGNGTNFVRAFDLAKKMVQPLTLQENGCPQRVVIVLTDGTPDVSGERMTENQLNAHFADVQRIVAQSFSGVGNILYITAINLPDLENNTGVWNRTERLWKETVSFKEGEKIPRADKVETQSEIGMRLMKIAHEILGEKGIIEVPVGPYVIPPYVDRLVLTFYKTQRSDTLVFTDSNGEMIDSSRTDMIIISKGNDQGIQSLEIIRPIPGRYQLGTTATKNEYTITAQTIFINARLSAPEAAMLQLKSSPIEIMLVDSKNNPLPDYGDAYKLSASAILSSADRQWEIALAHQMEQSKLVGRFTPLLADPYKLSIEALTRDADGKSITILNPNTVIYDLLVTPLSVEISKPKNANPECPPSQFTPISYDVQVLNASDKKFAKIDTPIIWEVMGRTGDKFDMSGPDAQGNYSLTTIPAQSGSWEFTLKGSVLDPLDSKTKYTFFDEKLNLSLKPGSLLKFSINGYYPTLNKIEESVEKLIENLTGKPPAITRVVGKRFLVIDQPVLIDATLTDLVSGSMVIDETYLPSLSLKSTELEGNAESIGWQFDKEDRSFSYIFKRVEQGDYQLQSNPALLPCGVQLQSDISPGLIRVTHDIWGRVLQLIILLLIALVIVWMIILLVCRFGNPVTVKIDILNSAQRPVPNHQHVVNNTSCWIRIETGTQEVCFITKLHLNSLFHRRGNFQVTVWYKDTKTGKIKQLRRDNCEGRNEIIPVPGGCSVKIYK